MILLCLCTVVGMGCTDSIGMVPNAGSRSSSDWFVDFGCRNFEIGAVETKYPIGIVAGFG